MAGMPRPAGFGSGGVSGSCAVRAFAANTRASPSIGSFQLCIFEFMVTMTLGHNNHIAGLQEDVVLRFFPGDDFLVIERELDLLSVYHAEHINAFYFRKLRES